MKRASEEGNTPPDAEMEQLIERARDGDGAALGELMEGCRDYLLFLANQNLDVDLLPKLGASDVVQQSMIVAHQKFHLFRGTTQQELLGWLRGILVNDLRHARRHYKQVQKRQSDLEENRDAQSRHLRQTADSMWTPGTQAAANEEAQQLEEAMSRLSAQQREVIQLRNWEHMAFEEIGKQIGKSAEATRKIWSRAVLELQQILTETGQISQRDE